MRLPLPFPFVFGVPLLPARRVIAIDAGNRVVKVALVQLFLNRVQVLRREVLEDAGTSAKDDATSGRLHELLKEFGPYPVALALPQHITLSQVMDLPPAPQAEIGKLIENETLKLAGLSETRIVHDYAPLSPFGRHQHSYWISLCQEKEFVAEAERLELDRENVCDAMSVGNALSAAYQWRIGATTPTVLADVGVRSTTGVVMYRGQPVHTFSFAMGAEMFFEPVASERSCSFQEAAKAAREKNLFEGPDASAMLPDAVSNWYDELVRLLREWLMDQRDLILDLQTFQFVLSGGGAWVAGLAPYLNRRFGAPRFLPWPEEEKQPQSHPPGHFAVALGAALQALGKNPHSASLLPSELRDKWTEQRLSQRLQSVGFLLLIVLTIMLGLGTWQKLSLASHKRALLQQAGEALRKASENEKVANKLALDYERIRPALERQRRTIDILQTLVGLQQVRSNRALWFGLFADQQSYFGAPRTTGEMPSTNLFPITAASTAETPGTNRPAIEPNLIAEVAIPEGGEAMRRTLSQLVAGLKQSHNFRNVDILPAEQRRSLADPKLIIPEHYFTIAFELAEKEFKASETSAGGQPAATNPPLRRATPPGNRPSHGTGAEMHKEGAGTR